VARSYALATRRVAAPYDLYSDTRSQVYLGVATERASTTAAVEQTASQVVVYNGQVATTYFFSTSGGRTANSTDVWSGPPTPYLVSVPDPYDAISPYHDWGPFPFTGAKLAKTFRSPGKVMDVRADVNGSGRITSLELLATNGTKDVPAAKVRAALKLRSTWFDVGVLALSRAAPVKPVEYGSQVQLNGLLRGLAGVSLEQRPSGATWQAVSAVGENPDGAVALTAKPTITTDYRLATDTLAAAPVRVSVAPRVRFAAEKTPGELRGSVRPVLANAAVQIQRQDEVSGTWTTIATTVVDGTGDFGAAVELTPGVYRARVAGTRGYAAGTTPPLRVVAR
jgi:SpoIID/LytB domain protein